MPGPTPGFRTHRTFLGKGWYLSEQASVAASWAMISLLTFYSLFCFHAIFLWFLFLLFFFLSAPQVSFFSEPDRTDFISLLQLAEFFKEPLGASVSLMISVKLKQRSLLSK